MWPFHVDHIWGKHACLTEKPGGKRFTPFLILYPPLSLSLFFSSGSAADSHWEGWLHRKGSSRDGRCRLGVLPWGEVRPGLQIPTRSRATHHCRGTGWHLPGLRQQLPRFAYLNLYKTQPVFGSMQFSQCQMVKKVVLYLVIKQVNVT